MPKLLQAVRGMRDVLPTEVPDWCHVEAHCQAVAHAYHYHEVRFPILERTALFRRTIGEETDIVFKEMYSFEDRNGDNLTLRPEGTAGCVRMALERGLLHRQAQRVWYLGPMFRRERPQKGRYRQFHHFGVEAFGLSSAAVDAEIIALSYRLWQRLGLQSDIRLELNSLGNQESRAHYRKHLLAYFSAHQGDLDEDSRRRLSVNPLRILDSKNPAMQDVIGQAPLLIEHLDPDSQRHFEQLKQHLDALAIPYELNPRLVRGLDYYGSTVFEWVTEALGAQGTVCAGGRYDGLVEQLGGRATPAVGMAMGMERVISLLGSARPCNVAPDIYWVLLGDAARQKGLVLSEQLRQRCPGIAIAMPASEGGIKSQFKCADKSGATWALIIGEDELARDRVSMKNLCEPVDQTMVSIDVLISRIENDMRAKNDL